MADEHHALEKDQEVVRGHSARRRGAAAGSGDIRSPISFKLPFNDKITINIPRNRVENVV